MLEALFVIDPIERERRIRIYHRVTPLFGTVQPAAVLKDAKRFGHILHHFAEGIFKPRWARYAFSISSMLSSSYSDQIDYLSDRSWPMAYSPKSGGLEIASNRALIACMDDREPLLVFRQTRDKKSAPGSHYLVAGLGMVERFETAAQVFRIRGLHAEEVSRYISGLIALISFSVFAFLSIGTGRFFPQIREAVGKPSQPGVNNWKLHAQVP